MRVGIIGLGNVSVMHINALKNTQEDLVAFCDIDIEKCKKANELYNLNCHIYTSYKEMLDCENLDSVHICTPHYLHCEMICECLQRNINVLCEKPLAISYNQLSTIKENVLKSKATLGVCFQNRYLKTTKYIKEFFKDKKVISGAANCFWLRDKKYYESGDWRGKKETEGGGVMINQAIHTLDLLQYICGMPKKVVAYTSNISLKGVIDVEDTAFGRFVFDDGNFIISATNSSNYTYPAQVMFHSQGDTVNLCDDNVLLNGNIVVSKDDITTMGKKVWGYGHELLINDFYSCLRNNKKFPIDFFEGEKTVKLVLAMYKSNGEEVDI